MKQKGNDETINLRKSGRKNMISQHMGTIIYFLSPLEFSKLCLSVETKIITLFDVVLRACR